MPLVIFDLDNTLIDRAVPFRRWADRFVARHGLDVGEVGWLVDADADGYVPRARFLSAVRQRYGLAEPVETLMSGFREQIVALTELDPRVAPALGRLRRDGWRIAVATNGTTAQQSAKIRRTGAEREHRSLATYGRRPVVAIRPK